MTGSGVGDAAIEVYVGLLHRYHATLDLMSPRALAALDRHLEDAEAYAAAVRDLVPPGLVLDLGTGAGLPAVVIAARAPSRPMAWVERRRRRATFLRSVVAHCGLASVGVHAADARTLDRGAVGPVRAVTAQAVGGWDTLYGATAQLHEEALTLVARRGAAWEDEVAAWAATMPARVEIARAEPLPNGGTLVALRVVGGLPCP